MAKNLKPNPTGLITGGVVTVLFLLFCGDFIATAFSLALYVLMARIYINIFYKDLE